MVRAFAAKFFKKIELFNFLPVEAFKPVSHTKPLSNGQKLPCSQLIGTVLPLQVHQIAFLLTQFMRYPYLF